jgi:hypothetical protein
MTASELVQHLSASLLTSLARSERFIFLLCKMMLFKFYLQQALELHQDLRLESKQKIMMLKSIDKDIIKLPKKYPPRLLQLDGIRLQKLPRIL